ERLYEESPSSSCIGNRTLVLETFWANRKFCNKLYKYSVNETTPDSERCRILKEKRNCDRNFVVSLCGDLYGWIIDRFYLSQSEEYNPECVSDLEKDQTPIPPKPAS
ncbi:hypothetical protein EGW08_019658, partial [Elysia chlorotica]